MPDPTPAGGVLRVVGIAGSLRRGSYNRSLLHAAVELAPQGLVIESHAIDAVPLYNADLDRDGERPAAVEALKTAVRDADAVLLASPEYNHGVPGVLKNVLDWLSRPAMKSPMAHKPTGFMGAAPGGGGTVRGQQHLKLILLGMLSQTFPHPGVAVARCKDKFDEEGRLTDEATRTFLRGYLSDFADWIRRVAPENASADAPEHP